ncbi:MAG: hypothetical protein KatS3mg111_3656 [Pirellulaceae bacterium]|nr:MAG: hypothetical protein KatS3mg111_3656 [Pirellulaceae bacterium]
MKAGYRVPEPLLMRKSRVEWQWASSHRGQRFMPLRQFVSPQTDSIQLRVMPSSTQRTRKKPILARREIPRPMHFWPAKRRMTALVFSVIFHVAVLTTAGVLWVGAPRGTGAPDDRAVGVAVVYESVSGEEEYFLTNDGAQSSTPTNSGEGTLAAALPSSTAAATAEELLSDLLPGDVSVGGDDLLAATGSLGLDEGGAAMGKRGEIPKARTSVFGVEGEGTRFLYVFDRSDSMNGYGGAPLRAAKAELIQSLSTLAPQHQFQIVFYNDSPLPFGGMRHGAPRLFKGDEAVKQSAISFVQGVTAIGGTRHLDALRMGLAMGPDCLFFLTDADQPALNVRHLDDIEMQASRSGTTIHAIQFGVGPRQGTNWIEELAGRTGGRYRYVDVTRLAP